jgi:Lon protease-like protein
LPESGETGAETTTELALFPLNAVLYPGGPLPLRIFEPRYVDMVRRSMRQQSAFGVILILSGAEAGAVASIAPVGTSARIVDFFPLPDGLLGIYCLGERRFRVLRHWCQEDGLNMGEVQWLPEEPATELPGQYQHFGVLLRKILPELGELYEPVEKRPNDASWVGFRLAEILPVALSEKQHWLELDDPLERLARLSPLLRRETDPG